MPYNQSSTTKSKEANPRASTSSSSNGRKAGMILPSSTPGDEIADLLLPIAPKSSQLQTFRDTKPRDDPWSSYTMRTSDRSGAKKDSSSRL